MFQQDHVLQSNNCAHQSDNRQCYGHMSHLYFSCMHVSTDPGAQLWVQSHNLVWHRFAEVDRDLNKWLWAEAHSHKKLSHLFSVFSSSWLLYTNVLLRYEQMRCTMIHIHHVVFIFLSHFVMGLSEGSSIADSIPLDL